MAPAAPFAFALADKKKKKGADALTIQILASAWRAAHAPRPHAYLSSVLRELLSLLMLRCPAVIFLLKLLILDVFPFYFFCLFALKPPHLLMQRMHFYLNLHLPGVFVFHYVNFAHLLSCIRCFIYFNYHNAKCLSKLQGLNHLGQGTLRLSNFPRRVALLSS